MIGKIGNFDIPRDNAYVNPSIQSPSTKEATVIDDKAKKRVGAVECQTCSTRTYVDGSDDAGVSFKSPTKISPGQAESAVMSHEKEHYNREAAQAQKEGAEVTTNRISITRDVCPECGRNYVSGGVTVTEKRKAVDSQHFNRQFYEENVGKHFGKVIDKMS